MAQSIWSLAGGIYYGYNDKGEEKLYTGDRMIATTGPNGSGKTRRLLIPNIFRLAGQWSMVIPDIKGELTAILAAHCEAMGSEVIILNPFGVLDIPSRGFNPIASMAIDDDMPDNAIGHAEAIITFKDTREPHFPQGAQDVYAGLEMYVRLVIDDGSPEDIRTFLGYSTEDFQTLLLAPEIEYKGKKYPGVIRAANTMCWPEIATKLNRFSDIKPDNRELLSIISTGLIQTRWLDSRRVKLDLKGPKYDFGRMKDRSVVVFLVLPPRRLATHATWFRLIITSIVQCLMNDVQEGDVPCLLALDEYFAIADGGFDIITKNMAMFRGYGIKLWTIWQDLSQAQKLLGHDGFETFLANAGIFQSFAPQDLTTSKYLSERTGQTTRIARSGSESRSHQPGNMPSSSASASRNQIATPLMLPQDVRAMRDGETLVLSHTLEHGQGLYYVPYPTEIDSLKGIMALDPTSKPRRRRAPKD